MRECGGETDHETYINYSIARAIMIGISIFSSKARIRLEREIRKCERDIELIDKYASITHTPPFSPAPPPAP